MLSPGSRLTGRLKVGVPVGVAVSLPFGVGERVGVGVGAGTRTFIPGASIGDNVQLDPPVAKLKSHWSNVICGFRSCSVFITVLNLTAMAIAVSPFFTMYHC